MPTKEKIAGMPLVERLSRRIPMQGRSQRTVGDILEATSRLLVSTGAREITTNTIAAEAGLSVGALYRFFPDKQSIIDAIAVRHIEAFQRSALIVLMSLGSFSGPDFVGGLIDHFVAFLEERPDFRAIAFGGHISSATRAAHSLPDSAGVNVLKKFMLKTLHAKNRSALDMKLKMAAETGERLIEFAFNQKSTEERAKVIAELKLMLSSYLFKG
jgi:AcrR family transcriptional regulator